MTLPECPKCGTEIPIHVDRCILCNSDVGFPNVRLAEIDEETRALETRIHSADVSAGALGTTEMLERFRSAADQSVAVIARNLQSLHTLLSNDNQLMATFHHQVRAQQRMPQNNNWDQGRVAAEGTISPNFQENVHYAALSLDGVGVKGFGDYFITLNEKMIANRASVLEENCFLFCQRHGVVAGTPPPFGYRTSWKNRSILAKAKLHAHVTPNTVDSDFPNVLLAQNSGNADADYIEVLIYGTLHQRSIIEVAGSEPKSRADRLLWRLCKGSLENLNIRLNEN